MEILSTEKLEFEAQEFKGLVCNREQIRAKEFTGCTFVKCSFRETVFREVKFKECTFKRCDLSLADLKGCSFSATQFEDSQLIGINWVETAWARNKFLKPVDFTGCALNHSTFMGLDLKKVSMLRCAVRDVDFSEANLTQANCAHTDFTGSRFQQTNLTEADFTGAQNYSIAPSQNTLKKTKFSLPEAMALLYGLDIILTDES